MFIDFYNNHSSMYDNVQRRDEFPIYLRRKSDSTRLLELQTKNDRKKVCTICYLTTCDCK